MSDLLRGILSCTLITIPETTFMVLLLITFCGRKELLDIYRFRENIKWYVILIIPPSLLIDTLNYGFKIQVKGFSSLISLVFLYSLIIYVFKKTAYEDVKYLKSKVLLRFIPLCLSMIAIELCTAPILFYFLKLTYIEISKNIYLILLCSLSSRIIELGIMIVILVKKHRKFQINFLDYVYHNNFFRKFSTYTMILLLLFEVYVVKLIAYNNILNAIESLAEQIMFVVCFTYLIPFLILTGVYILINYCITLYNSDQQNHDLSFDKDNVSD